MRGEVGLLLGKQLLLVEQVLLLELALLLVEVLLSQELLALEVELGLFLLQDEELLGGVGIGGGRQGPLAAAVGGGECARLPLEPRGHAERWGVGWSGWAAAAVGAERNGRARGHGRRRARDEQGRHTRGAGTAVRGARQAPRAGGADA